MSLVFEEVHVAQLNSCTSCYTGVRRLQGNSTRSDNTRRSSNYDFTAFATESHALHLACHPVKDCDTGMAKSDDHPSNIGIQLTSEPVPRPNDCSTTVAVPPVCVGYSSFCSEAGDLWEAFALIEKNNNNNNLPAVAVTNSLPDDTTVRTDASVNMNMTGSNHTNNMDPPQILHPNCWLVLKHSPSKLPGSSDDDEVSNIDAAPAVEYSTPLSFRPLSPCVAYLGVSLSVSMGGESASRMGVWIGSAEDTETRLFVPDDAANTNTLRLVDITLQENTCHSTGERSTSTSSGSDNHTGTSEHILSFSSPVMAMESLHRGGRNYLAAACQDGTIRLVTFVATSTRPPSDGGGQSSSGTLALTNIDVFQTIVDGPILEVCLSNCNDRVHVLVGSLCGFVCQLWRQSTVTTKNGNPAQSQWNGPYMIVEGLWDGRLNVEDSVLAVHTWKDRVAVGTYSGLLAVWKSTTPNNNNEYELEWQCQLPYSIHGIFSTVDHGSNENENGEYDNNNNNNNNSSSSLLLVTTRRTLHIFRGQRRMRYSAETAKRRIERLIRERER